MQALIRVKAESNDVNDFYMPIADKNQAPASHPA
jgi:hypothetical protein